MFSQTSSLNISVQCNYFNETPPLNFKLLKARREQIFRLKKAVKIRFFDFFFSQTHWQQMPKCNLCFGNILKVGLAEKFDWSSNSTIRSLHIECFKFRVEICRIKGSVSSGFFLKKLESNTCQRQNQNPAKHLWCSDYFIF